MEYTSEQIRAAYALNLCTVSVSQIIDYDDINIMEHEYEAILNNINIEMMPKDEALLNILKQILDTITFFRIEEGDKKQIDKEYQQKMKNAIWSAVPNIGLLVAGGNPVTMAVSLASQVGIGYMNYRRVRSEADLEKERNRWQLERTAIDQFNGLRRELFDTAWRLENEYDFPDELRLTERQIKQYDAILMDNDLIRRYERLDAIKDKFIAYPPFWYQIGNTANAIAGSDDYELSDETKGYYRNLAISHFDQYRVSNEYGLLREDQVSAACALEYIDLLDVEKDSELIRNLLDEAVNASGKANDVLQLCALSYLRIGDEEAAAKLFRILVNEQYNTVINSQILSSIYLAKYIEGNKDIKADYEILQNRVGERYLYQLPESTSETVETLQEKFVELQRKVLKRKYELVMQEFMYKYMIEYGKLIPAPPVAKVIGDEYYLEYREAIEARKKDIDRLARDNNRMSEYCYMLKVSNISEKMLDIFNDIYDAVCTLDMFQNEDTREEIAEIIEKGFAVNKNRIEGMFAAIGNANNDADTVKSYLDMRFGILARPLFKLLKDKIDNNIDRLNNSYDFSLSEQSLVTFCDREGIASPELLFGKDGEDFKSVKRVAKRRFDLDILGREAVKQNKAKLISRDMMPILEDYIPQVVQDDKRVAFFTANDPKLNAYFDNNVKLKSEDNLRSTTIAVLDDMSRLTDYDLVFTTAGIVPVKKGAIKTLLPYGRIRWAENNRQELLLGGRFNNSNLDMDKLYELIKELAKYEQTRSEYSYIIDIE